MLTLESFKGALGLLWDTLYLSELAQIIVNRWPEARPYIRPALLSPHPARQTNGLGAFLRAAPNGSALDKLRELVERFSVTLSYLMPSCAWRYFLTGCWMWMHHGRRVYALDHDLERVLLATSPSRYTWQELRFPLEAFVLKLARPLLHPYGESEATRAISNLLVVRLTAEEATLALGLNHPAQTPVILIAAVPDHYALYHPIPEGDRLSWIRNALKFRKGDGRFVNQAMAFADRRFMSMKPIENYAPLEVMIIRDAALSTPIRSSLTEAIGIHDFQGRDGGDALPGFLDQVGGLVGSFLLFLEFMHHPGRRAPTSQNWRRVAIQHPAPGDVITDSQLWDVTHAFVLTDDQREGLDEFIWGAGTSGRILRWTVRAGHWRHFPFRPLDPPEVYVSPTVVRRENLLVGTLPGGAVAKPS